MDCGSEPDDESSLLNTKLSSASQMPRPSATARQMMESTIRMTLPAPLFGFPPSLPSFQTASLPARNCLA